MPEFLPSLDGQITSDDVKTRKEKQFALPEFRFTVSIARPEPAEGRFAIVTMRWAQDAMDAAISGVTA
jgi:hypothetical protein